MVPGTHGYQNHIAQFVALSQALEFNQTNGDFLPYLPQPGANVLDAGCGAGQNAAALAGLGYRVVAVDPMHPFLEAARSSYCNLEIEWFLDSFPLLQSLGSSQFDFILVDGVWHHLSPSEREQAMHRLYELLVDGGRCAISLRNGPAGMGSCVHPTDPDHTRASAEALGLRCIFLVEHQPSILKNKEDVEWSRMVLEKGESA